MSKVILRGLRLILFDLDGTLVDSEDAIVESFRKASELTGVKIDLNKLRSLLGRPLMDVVKGSLVKDVDEKKLMEYIRIRRRIMNEIWRDRVKLFPDVIPTLRELKNRGYILGVASSSTISRVKEFLEHFGILHYFDVISGVIEGKIFGKPRPDTILYAVKKINVEPSKVLYIGDMEVDCIAAINARVRFIRLARKVNDHWRCKPILTIRSLLELLNILA
ncbi:MAG: HAD family hydrolase [Thermoprotei archaeon]|nr:MAG: HAD family hydrolase [Thermoprotei archaeon]